MKSLQNEFSLPAKLCNEICSHRVLMVDDVPFNLVPLESFLDDRRVSYTSVFSGAKAVQLFMARLSA